MEGGWRVVSCGLFRGEVRSGKEDRLDLRRVESSPFSFSGLWRNRRGHSLA